MRGKAMLVVGVAIGYAVGTRQGRQGWNRLVTTVRKGLGLPVVQKTLAQTADLAEDRVPVVGGALSSAVQRVAASGTGGRSSTRGRSGADVASGTSTEPDADSGTTMKAATPAPATSDEDGGADGLAHD